MSLDTTFQPRGKTYAVDNSGPVQCTEAGQCGATTFRIRAITAAGYISWSAKSPPPTPAAPAIGTPVANCIGLGLGAVIYLELPPDSFFLGNAAFGTGSFEVTPGIGGVGG